LKKNQLEENIV